MMKRILTLLKPYKWHVVGACLLSALTLVTGIGLMGTSGYLISRAAQRPMIVDLFMVTAAVRFFGISRAVVRYFERLVSHDLTFKLLLTLRSHLYRKLDSLSLGWMLQRRPGDLLATIITDIETYQHVFLRIISPGIVAVILSLLTGMMMAIIDTGLAVVTLLFLFVGGALVPLLAIYLGKKRGGAEVKIKAGQKVFLVDHLQGLQDLLWMGRVKHAEQEFTTMQSSIDNIQLKQSGISGLLEGLNIFVSHSAAFVVLLMAIPLVLAGDIQGVMLAMLVLGVLSSFEAVQGLGNAFLQYDKIRESSDRLFSIMDQEEEKHTLNMSLPAPKSLAFSFDELTYSYHDEAAVQGISFNLPYGSKTAIVGPVGSGKSTLVDLLLRFREPDKGAIRWCDTDIRSIDAGHLRALFAMSTQNGYVFNRSLRENLMISDPSAGDHQVVQVLKMVGLGEFAGDLDLQLGSQGMRLSGGQRQLLLLARVLLKDAPIWIFDEPTAHLDVHSERRVLDTIWSNVGSRTCLVITHRLIDMEKMDQIIVMDRGRIVEQGTHAELIGEDGFYCRMVHHQQQVLRS